jgi:hypothetical protein
LSTISFSRTDAVEEGFQIAGRSVK